MSEDEAIAVARKAVEERGGVLTPIIKARKTRRWLFFGHAHWQVVSNRPNRGGNWWLTVDDENGAVRSIGFSKR